MFKDYAGVEILAKEAIRAEHFATSDLLFAKPDDIAGEVLAWMTGNDFDIVPVRGNVDRGFIRKEALREIDRQSRIRDVIQPLDEALIFTPLLPLEDALFQLAENGWFFLEENGTLVGIATREDLGKPAVSLYLFAKTIAFETGLRRLAGTYDTTPIPDSPPDENDETPGPRFLREVILKAKQNKALLKDLGYAGKGSSGRFDELTKFINRLRNHIAHGRSILAISEKSESYSSRLKELDALLATMRTLTEHSTQAWEAYASTQIIHRVVIEEIWAGVDAGDLPEGGPWIILTASNPHEEVLGEAENRARNHELVNLIKQRGYESIPVEGRSRCGRWTEESVAIHGMPREEAAELCRLFRQRGFFEITDSELVVYSADGLKMRQRRRVFKPE
jgi:hypothetical protein